MELKVVKYRNIGIVEDNYVENDYWDEHKYCGFELSNGKCIVYIYTINNFGDDSLGSESECRYIESLNIETVASVGEKVFVIINGQRLREGDLINNLLIESIDNQKITFEMGNTIIIKDVGS